MIYSEFKIENKKYGDTVKRVPYIPIHSTIRIGELIDVEFPEEGIRWECAVVKYREVESGDDALVIFDLKGMSSGRINASDDEMTLIT